MQNILSSLCSLIWGGVFIPLFVICAALLTYHSRAVQIRRFGAALRIPFRKTQGCRGDFTPLQAASTALASTIGTGNIIGTAQAVCVGGPGALFWMWVTALLGMVVKYAEIFLASYCQGNISAPMNYISRALSTRAAKLFALSAALSGLGMGCMTQVSSIRDAVSSLDIFSVLNTQSLSFRLSLGFLIAAVTALLLRSGQSHIGRAAQLLVPVMSCCFLFCTLSVILVNSRRLASVFAMIFRDAFSFRAAGGGFSGACLICGVRRGVFSNEAGLGSAALAHSEVKSSDHTQQGLWGIFEVFADTILICTATGLAILSSSVPLSAGNPAGANLLQIAAAGVFGTETATVIVSGTLCLFAYTTVMAWAVYGSLCANYLFGKKYADCYTYLYLAAIPISCVMSTGMVWSIADLCNALMSIPNLLSLIVFSKLIGEESRGL